MENASKALIMAGSILIAIMIISLGIYVFNKFKPYAEEYADLTEQEIAAFNSELVSYTGDSVQGAYVNALIERVIAIDYAAISDDDNVKRVNITGEVTVTCNANDTDVTIGTTRKVDTAGKYYKVTPTYGDSGLIKTINITQN